MLIDVVCDHCGRTFQRERGELNRNGTKGRKRYCSRSCAGKCMVSHFGDKRKWDHLVSGRFTDEYSKFRVFLHRIGRRKKECNITVEDLKAQWEKQDGKCPYTGWLLQTPAHTRELRPIVPDAASLDRIDSSKGYIKGNIEFVCLMAQYAKNGFSREDVFTFCREVANLHSGGTNEQKDRV